MFLIVHRFKKLDEVDWFDDIVWVNDTYSKSSTCKNQANIKTKVSIKSQINIDEIKRYNKKVKTPIMVLENDQFHECSQTNPPISVLKRHFISTSHLCTTCCGLLYSQGPTGGGIVTLSRGFPPLASAERWKPAQSCRMAHRQLQLRPMKGGKKTQGPARSGPFTDRLVWTGWKCGEQNEGKAMDEKTGWGSDSEGGGDGGSVDGGMENNGWMQS